MGRKRESQFEAPNWADWCVLLLSLLASGPAALVEFLTNAAGILNFHSQTIDDRKRFAREAHMALEQITGEGK